MAPSTLSRIENGLAPAKPVYLDELLDLYGVDDLERREELAQMAAHGQRKEWWASCHRLLPAGTATYLGLEAAAVRVRAFAANAVPGVLQIPVYAAAAIKAARPGLTAHEVRALVICRGQP